MEYRKLKKNTLRDSVKKTNIHATVDKEMIQIIRNI